jgi:hypothetical protein
MEILVENPVATIGIGILVISLLGLGGVYGRSRQAAQARQTQLQLELDSLRQISEATQQALEHKLQQVSETLQTTQRDKADLETQIEALKQQCVRLREALENQALQVQQDTQAAAFEQLQTLLTQYPSVRRMAELKPELPARNLVALLTALDNLLQFWQCQPIGQPWAAIAYDPQLHQGDVADLAPGETVYIRFVGYQRGETVLVPAKVSRTLPAGVNRSGQGNLTH